jgi:hypothetical protein
MITGVNMKLRIKGNSIRLRLLRSEVAGLINNELIEEKIYLGPGDQSVFTYALATDSGLGTTELRYEPSRIFIVLPKASATSWADTNEVGIYASIDIGRQENLDLIVEKDFACLDLSDADNLDTFTNPELESAC